jgi:hypothetical protein
MSIKLNQPEAKAMWNDIVKFLVVAVVIHILFYTVDDYGGFLNEAVLKVFLYITLGLLTYHLIVNKLIEKYLLPTKKQTTKTIAKETPKKITNNSQKKQIKPILKKERSRSRSKKNKKVKFKL